MRRQARGLALVLALVLLPALAAAQSLTGTISGKVTDQQGGVLPGVTVSLLSKTGTQTQVSDANGDFRFVGLNPGEYEVRCDLQGFKPKAESGIVLGISRTVDLRVQMVVGGLSETVDVTANAVSIDTTTTATDNTVNKNLLFSMPISRTNAAVNMLNYTPGANAGSAFGGNSDYANALLLDGVDTRDPEGGSAWTFFNYNIIEEVQVGGLGQPAEYGGFTGAVVNTITKSGGNKFSALFEWRTSSEGLGSDNVSEDVKTKNPSLADPTKIKRLNDYTVQLGGPIVKDKLFFFGSVQRYSVQDNPSGPIQLHKEVSPRFNVKFTYQATPNDTVILGLQYDNYNQWGRSASFSGTYSTTQDRTRNQDSPEWIWNLQYRKVFGTSTFLEAKYTGYWGYYDLTPITPGPVHYDGDTGAYSGGGGTIAKYDRTRNQVNVALTKYASLAGQHAFKFGAEIERSSIRNRWDYATDPNNGNKPLFFYDYAGEPYLAYSYTSDVKGKNKRETVYAQDQWKIGSRLTANFGVRVDRIRGVTTADDKEVYKATPIAPRLGVAFDITGKGTSVLKAFYGQLYEGAVFLTWERAAPGISDWVVYEVLPGWKLGPEVDRVSGASKYTVASDLKHPRTDEWNVAFEQQLFHNYKVTATYVHRANKNFIDSVLRGATWNPVSYTNPMTKAAMTLYSWANRSSIDQKYDIINIDGYQYKSPSGQVLGTIKPYRDYDGLMFVLQRALKNRWQGQASYVWSRSKGTIDNDMSEGAYSSNFETPNLALINRDGFASYDRTHEVKVYAGWQIPKIEVMLGGYYTYISGYPWQAYARVSGSTVNYTSSINVNIEPRGSRRTDAVSRLDLRAEKVFNVGIHRFGIYADAANLFNNGTVTWVQTRYPSASIAGTTVAFGDPASIGSARQVTLGLRWSF
jgi:hypothetical protein